VHHSMIPLQFTSSTLTAVWQCYTLHQVHAS